MSSARASANTRHLVNEFPTFRCHEETPARALENDRFEPRFKLADLHRERGLGNPTLLRCFHEAAAICNGDNIFQIAQGKTG